MDEEFEFDSRVPSGFSEGDMENAKAWLGSDARLLHRLQPKDVQLHKVWNEGQATADGFFDDDTSLRGVMKANKNVSTNTHVDSHDMTEVIAFVKGSRVRKLVPSKELDGRPHFESYECDWCSKHPILGYRWSCLSCDFDLCSECVAVWSRNPRSEIHDPAHTLVRFLIEVEKKRRSLARNMDGPAANEQPKKRRKSKGVRQSATKSKWKPATKQKSRQNRKRGKSHTAPLSAPGRAAFSSRPSSASDMAFDGSVASVTGALLDLPHADPADVQQLNEELSELKIILPDLEIPSDKADWTVRFYETGVEAFSDACEKLKLSKMTTPMKRFFMHNAIVLAEVLETAFFNSLYYDDKKLEFDSKSIAAVWIGVMKQILLKDESLLEKFSGSVPRSIEGYYDTISEPMDLRTLETIIEKHGVHSTRIADDQFSMMEDFVRMLELIWQNALSFYPKGSSTANSARYLSRLSACIVANMISIWDQTKNRYGEKTTFPSAFHEYDAVKPKWDPSFESLLPLTTKKGSKKSAAPDAVLSVEILSQQLNKLINRIDKVERFFQDLFQNYRQG